MIKSILISLSFAITAQCADVVLGNASDITWVQSDGANKIVSFGTAWTPLILNPLAWWKADNNANDYYNVRNGAWTGTEAYAAGINSNAFNFTRNTIVNCGTNYQITTELTICAWIKPLTYNGVAFSRIAGVDDGKWTVYTVEAGVGFYGSGIDGTFNPSITAPTNQWTHVTVRYKDGENITGWKNGTNIATLLKSGPLTAAGTSPFCIGNRPSINRQFLGFIDDVMVFDRALTTNEIQRLYNWRQ